MRPECPTQQQLVQLSFGELADAEIALVGRHLESCGDCLKRMETICHEQATFAAGISEIPSEISYEAEPGYQQFAEFLSKSSAARSSELLQGSSPPDSLTEVGPYKIVCLLGRGGMSTVYEAKHESLGQQVALKVLDERAQTRQLEQRFQREMKAIGMLDSRHVVKAFDAGQADDVQFLAMELVDGFDLSRIQKSLQRLAIGDACEIIRQAAFGLAHIASHGLVHRDLKPSNLMLTSDGIVKILDLGLARGDEYWAPGELDSTKTGQIIGTLDYMAPEQGVESKAVDIRADLYSLGATLYKLISGQAPYAQENASSLLEKLRRMSLTDATPIEQMRPDIPESLAKLIHQLLSRNPDERLASPEELAARLLPFSETADLWELHRQTQELKPHEPQKQERSKALNVLPDIEVEGKRNLRVPVIWSLLALASVVAALFVFRRPPDDEIHLATTPAERIESAVESNVLPPILRQPTRLLAGHSELIFGVEFLDDDRLASCSWDNTVRIWDRETGEQIKQYHGKDKLFFLAMDIARDKQLIAAGTSGGSVFFFHPDSDDHVGGILMEEEPSPISALAFSADESRLLIGNLLGGCGVYDVETGRLLGYFKGKENKVHNASFLDQEHVLLCFNNVIQLHELKTFELKQEWDVAAPDRAAHLDLGNERGVISGPGYRNISVLDLKSGDITDTWTGHKGVVLGLEKVVRGETLLVASTSNDKTVRFWDPESGEEQFRIEADGYVTQRIAVSPNGRWVASGGGWHVARKIIHDEDYQLRLWDVSTMFEQNDHNKGELQ